MLMFTKFLNRINASCKFITNDLILDNKVTVTHIYIYVWLLLSTTSLSLTNLFLARICIDETMKYFPFNSMMKNGI